jgi:predicted RNA polymerase sigma factor
VALARAGDVNRSIAVVDSLGYFRLINYQPYWVAKPYVTQLQGQTVLALECTNSAVGLTRSPSIRSYLLGKLEGFNK